MITKLLKNLFSKAETDSTTKANLAEQSAKDYAYSLRHLDYANAVKPLSADKKSDWTYTAQEDGLLILHFVATTREYMTASVNGTVVFYITPDYISGSSVPMANVAQVELQEGDVFTITGVKTNGYLGKSTIFVPYKVGGVILNLFHALLERGCVA